ncbi:MAG: hypothetical protein H6825_00275 [Planctomycetes bacterium]|nr:hypothetical protein [Planctomycetota bacterium]
MPPVLVYLTGIALAGGVAFAVVRSLQPSLQRLLVDLCGTDDRARFWTAFSGVMLVLVPLIGAMMHRPTLTSDWDALFDLTLQLRLALIGLVAATLCLGLVLSRFIPRQDPSPPAPGGPARTPDAPPAEPMLHGS